MINKRVRMFVFNNCANDARVLKESATLVKAGFDVEVVAFLDRKTVPFETREGVRIVRLRTDPINARLIRIFGNPLHYRPKWLKRKVRIPRSTKPTLRRRSESLRRIKVLLRALRLRALDRLGVSYENMEHAKAELTRQAIPLFMKAPLLMTQLGFIYVVLVGWRFFHRLLRRGKRYLKKGVRSISRNLIQEPLRWLLRPAHRYFVYFDFFWKARRHSMAQPADIYHCHDLNTLLIGIVLRKKHNAKLVYDSHELYLHKNRLKPAGKFKTILLRYIERKGMRAADRVITVGACIAEWMAKEYQSELPAVIINAPRQRDETQLRNNVSLRTALEVKDGDFLLIYSGGITFNRGLENVIKAVNQIDGLRFVMLGYGSDAYVSSLKALIHSEGAEEKVSFFGPVPHYEVASYLASADCGIAPILNICLSYYYCSPNKLFEYVQARLPVLASDFPEMKLVVNENDIGFTFNPDEIESIKTAIRKMMDNPSERKRFKENTQKAAEKYRWAVEEKKLEGIYLAL